MRVGCPFALAAALGILLPPFVGATTTAADDFVARPIGPADPLPFQTQAVAPWPAGAREFVPPPLDAGAQLPPVGGPSLEDRVRELELQLTKLHAQESAAKEATQARPTCRVTGVINFDTAFFGQDAASEIQFRPGTDVNDAVGFRRLRLGVGGEAFQVCYYRLEVDFAPFLSVRNATDDGSVTIDQVSVKSAYVGLRDVPVLGDVRVGHIKEPFSLEHVNRDRYSTFMERSLPDQGNLVPLRSPGIEAMNHSADRRMTWQFGAFVPDVPETPPLFLGTQAGAAFTGRVTCLPWYDEAEGSHYLHLGAAYSYRANATGNLVYAAHPECFFGPIVVTTSGQLNGADGDVDHNQLLGSELAFIYGPLCVQSEYYRSYVDRRLHPDVQFPGFYAYATYFLTGEHKPYDRNRGAFDRLVPRANFCYFRDGEHTFASGWGAWQVGYRFSTLDLDDGLVQGGAIRSHTLGLNWYWNPYTKLQFNYVVADVSRELHGVSEGTMQIFETRVAIDF